MTTKQFTRTAILKCKSEKIEEFKLAIAKLAHETVKESGCVLFKIFQNDNQADEFILWEIFKDEAALDQHMNQNYTNKCFALGLFEVVSATSHTEII